jgi:hypothetical protein
MTSPNWRQLAMNAPRINFRLQVMQYQAEQIAAGRDIRYGDAYVEYANAHPILYRLSIEQLMEDLDRLGSAS